MGIGRGNEWMGKGGRGGGGKDSKMTKEAVSRIQSHADKTGRPADYLETLLRKVLIEYMKALKETKSRDAIIQAQEDKILSDVSLSLLERKDIPASSLLDYLISLGGTPKRVIELLKAQRIIDEKQQT